MLFLILLSSGGSIDAERVRVSLTDNDFIQISLASKTKKHDPKYYLTVSVTSSSSATPSTWQLACPFTTWFTADGYFVAQPFQQWLAGSIVVIGDVDTKHARKEEVADLLSASGVDVGEMQGNGTPGAGKGKKGKRKG